MQRVHRSREALVGVVAAVMPCLASHADGMAAFAYFRNVAFATARRGRHSRALAVIGSRFELSICLVHEDRFKIRLRPRLYVTIDRRGIAIKSYANERISKGKGKS